MSEKRATSTEEGFLKRWSRRKQEAAVVAAPAPSQEAIVAPAPSQEALGARPVLPPKEGVAMAAQEPSPLTLADTESLTLESDFKPFLASNVAPEVKNAAFKKLFADPHFNVMDGMDIYVDDYSNPSPLPTSVLRQMASAKFLNLFEEEETEAPASAGPTDIPATPVVASAEAAEAQPASHLPDDPQDPDLRLQPDNAAGAEDARRGTG
ncbi:DUF3306 domain-containing protein [Variovorax robiniae]|uniref:DUF3306 domain-containing protein n=1 Tax=Variovorax robiniae TaxID=1836199 RepID=A0ABU8X973_9BURK